ncbi:MAG: hypothetical protein ABGU93_07170 [Acetobacterium sp.]|uniref:hypothetical protein n=1 Tax=Acetobacterium sp. TaxID=1872094 RepID=UPI003241D246
MDNLELKKDIEGLVQMLEDREEIKVIVKSVGNKININEYPYDFNSDFQIDFRVKENEFRLALLYLIKRNTGTGSKIIDWILNYCRTKKIDSLLIANISAEKKEMIKLCKKYNGSWENVCKCEGLTYRDYRIIL